MFLKSFRKTNYRARWVVATIPAERAQCALAYPKIMSLEIIFSWPHLHYFGKKRMSLLIRLLTNLSGFSLSEAITLKIDFSKSQSSWSIKDTKKLKIGNERGKKTSSEQYFTLLKIWYKRITWYIEERAELALHGSLTLQVALTVSSFFNHPLCVSPQTNEAEILHNGLILYNKQTIHCTEYNFQIDPICRTNFTRSKISKNRPSRSSETSGVNMSQGLFPV